MCVCVVGFVVVGGVGFFVLFLVVWGFCVCFLFGLCCLFFFLIFASSALR